jgi:hypothetical protein
MKRFFSLACFCIICVAAYPQAITITASDMPASGDSLRYSIGNIIGSSINVYDSGTNKAWVFDTSALQPIAQAFDKYQKASDVNFTYGLTIGSTDFGYKVADSIPGIGTAIPGLSITDIYTFFNEHSTTPKSFNATAFAAMINSFPVPANYSDQDEWYFFPLTYPHGTDSSTFAVNINLPSIGSLKRKGYRKTRVDGWGTIQTPYFTTPANCIRVQSYIHEIDTIKITAISFNLALVLDSVEYKWLVNGEHYPALWITTSAATGRITGITYRDSLRHGVLSVPKTSQNVREIKAWPNPASDGMVQLELPSAWQKFDVWVYDISGRVVKQFTNTKEIDISSLQAGCYNLIIYSNGNIGYSQITRE